jgi:nitrogen fixation/metabolism regulation signal transduction histidine kinase
MIRLRTRLIVAFLAATVLPLGATIWITKSLLDRSLGYATTGELDRLSRTLEATVRQFYQRERDALRQDALSGRAEPVLYPVASAAEWPGAVRAFWDSGDAERFGLAGPSGDRVEYMRRRGEGPGRGAEGVETFSRDLHGMRMDQLTADLRQTRQLVESIQSRDLRRGFTLTLLLLLGAAWLVSLVPLIFIAHRVSQPIGRLTAALTDFAAGDWSRRLGPGPEQRASRDEVGRAIEAFNRMADQLQQSRERLVHVTRMASWQSLARKTAHELKNSLTPIRLAVEEMQARQPPADRAFMDRAVHIVVSEIDSLERRVRAFSDFSSEPPVAPATLDVNAILGERMMFLRPAYPETRFEMKLDAHQPKAYAGADLLRGILTNLLQNAAEAAGPGGSVLVCTGAASDRIAIEVHDSGPGLSQEALATLFQPTITFKKHGMGLGLSIAKSHALLSGGDIVQIDGQLGGAGFRVTLPTADGPAVREHAV